MEPLVSIITPCFNGEKFVERFLESVCNQTYSNIELIFINDGSTDNTESIVLSFQKKFQERGISFHYIVQENQGQAACLNTGLKIFQGDYLIWPDSDDWMSDTSIEKKVSFLEMNPDYALVRSNGYFYQECNLGNPIREIAKSSDKTLKNIFMNLLFETTYCCCGCYMARTKDFLKSNSNRTILKSRAGQNFQLEIPIAYQNKCGYIDDCLYHVVERNESHSREQRSFEQALDRNQLIKEIKIWCIEQVVHDKKLIKQLCEYHDVRAFYIALDYRDKKEAKLILNRLSTSENFNYQKKKTYLKQYHREFNFYFRLIYWIKRKLTSKNSLKGSTQ